MRPLLTLLLPFLLCTCAPSPTGRVISRAPVTFAADAKLLSGPMLGYNEQQEVAIWVQTDAPGRVHIEYTDGEKRLTTDTVNTERRTAHAATLIADAVRPGQRYTYELFINNRRVKLPYPTEFTAQSTWRWRTDPPDFTLAIGSCNYINEPEMDRPGSGYGRSYDIFTAIDEKRPDLMVWLGDNMYLREPDWYTRTGYQHRYTHTRQVPTLQPLLARTHHYAIWDDHDYGPNNSDRSWVNRELAKETFDLFWANPTSGLKMSEQRYGSAGITSMFRYNDIDVFLLDNRSFRTPNEQVRKDNVELLGEPQLEWLIDNLVFSDAPWKLVCVGGQVLNTAEVFENYINLAPNELRYLLARINEENIEGVVFVTGDRHHTELSELRLPNGKMVYDVTVSPLTAGTGNPESEVNKNRVAGTLTTVNNFGLLRFSGPLEDRRLEVVVFDGDGEELWARPLVR